MNMPISISLISKCMLKLFVYHIDNIILDSTSFNISIEKCERSLFLISTIQKLLEYLGPSGTEK